MPVSGDQPGKRYLHPLQSLTDIITMTEEISKWDIAKKIASPKCTYLGATCKTITSMCC
jgi:ornithine carbamoyltransferase